MQYAYNIYTYIIKIGLKSAVSHVREFDQS